MQEIKHDGSKTLSEYFDERDLEEAINKAKGDPANKEIHTFRINRHMRRKMNKLKKLSKT